jgi:hypothetical protein
MMLLKNEDAHKFWRLKRCPLGAFPGEKGEKAKIKGLYYTNGNSFHLALNIYQFYMKKL